MALPLSNTALRKLQQSKIEPQIIMEIEGFSQTFGTNVIKSIPKIGQTGLVIGGFIIGGLVELEGQRPIISVSKTRLSLDQQLEPDRGGVQSVSRINIFLIDNGAELVELFRPGNIVPDIMGKNARIYIGFKDTSHPEDSALLVSGVIDSIEFPPGGCVLAIAHPEQLKRTELFKKGITELAANISDSVTTIGLLDTSDFIEPTGRVKSYVAINEEIIQYAGISGNNLTGCTRGQKGTTAATHDIEDTVSSRYGIEGDAINSSLELLLSGGSEFFGENQGVTNIVQVGPSLVVPNSIFFKGIDIEKLYNLVTGDFAIIEGSGFAANNESRVINSFVKVENGSYIELIGGSEMIVEAGSNATVKFKSKYNVLNIGVGMSPLLVDVPEFERIFETFNANLPDLDLPIHDNIEATELINKKILFTSGLYPVPRKGRVSISIVTKPLVGFGTIILDEKNIVRPERLVIKRSMNKHFYNKIKFLYAEEFLDSDEFKKTKEKTSSKSKERINIKDKPLIIEAGGLRDNNETVNLINRMFTEFLDRYQFGAERVDKVRVLYKDGLQIEVADTVLFNPGKLFLADPSNGTRDFVTRLMLVINVNKSIEGIIEIDLIDTALDLKGRYGVISTASKILSGSTVSTIKITDVFEELASDVQRDKWSKWIGEKILVRSDDFTIQEVVTLKGFNPANGNEMLVEPDLSFIPPENGRVEIPNYPSGTDQKENMLYKASYCFMTPQVKITAGVSSTEFTVSAGDIAKFKVGAAIKVHNVDFTVNAEETFVSEIIGNNIKTEDDLGFTPTNNEVVNLIGFNDKGEPYRIL